MENPNHEHNDVQEWVNQGQVLTGQGLFAEAETYFNKAIAADPMNYAAYMSRGILWASSDQLDKAREDFKKAAKVNKEIPDAYYHLGNIAFLQGDFEEGVKQFNMAIAKGYDDAELYFHFGMVYEENQQYETAIRHYAKASRMEPLNPEFRIRKAVTQTKAELWEEALETLDGLYQIAPDSFEYFHLKAMVLISLSRLEEAEVLLAEANRQFPDDLDLLNDRISILVTQGKDSQALQYIAQIKDRMEEPGALQRLLISEAKIYTAQQDGPRAIASLNRALALDGIPAQSTEALYILINIHLVEAQYDAMLSAAEKLIAYGNINTYALSGWYYAAVAKKARGDKDAEAYYREILRNYRTFALEDPARIDAYIYRAMAYKDLQEYPKALEMVDYVLLLQPDNGDLHMIKAIIYAEMGKESEAQAEKLLAKDGHFLRGLD